MYNEYSIIADLLNMNKALSCLTLFPGGSRLSIFPAAAFLVLLGRVVASGVCLRLLLLLGRGGGGWLRLRGLWGRRRRCGRLLLRRRGRLLLLGFL